MGQSSTAAVRRELVHYAARLDQHIQRLDAALERVGMVDGQGRLRTEWLRQLTRLVDLRLRLEDHLPPPQDVSLAAWTDGEIKELRVDLREIRKLYTKGNEGVAADTATSSEP